MYELMNCMDELICFDKTTDIGDGESGSIRTRINFYATGHTLMEQDFFYNPDLSNKSEQFLEEELVWEAAERIIGKSVLYDDKKGWIVEDFSEGDKLSRSISPWLDNTIQFPRLIDEIQAANGFTDEVLDIMSQSMDLERHEILELVCRASKIYDEIKIKL